MTLTDQILSVAQAYAAAENVPLKTVSSRVFDDGKKLDALAERRGSITLASADKALSWFSAHWPEGLVWPETVARPEASPSPSNPAPNDVDSVADVAGAA